MQEPLGAVVTKLGIISEDRRGMAIACASRTIVMIVLYDLPVCTSWLTNIVKAASCQLARN